MAKIIPTLNVSLDFEVANFVFASMCEYGFAKCVFVEPSEILFRSCMKHLNNFWTALSGDKLDITPEDLWSFTNETDEISEGLKNEVSAYAQSNHETWETLFNVWLFQLRTSVKHEKSPFSVMFNRNPFSKRYIFKIEAFFITIYELRSFFLFCKLISQWYTKFRNISKV